MFDSARTVVVVMTADLPSIKNVRLLLGTVESLGYDREKLQLILNRSGAMTGINVRSVEAALDRPIGHHIVNDYRTAMTAVNRGAPFMFDTPDAPLSRSVMDFARAIDGAARPAGAAAPAEARPALTAARPARPTVTRLQPRLSPGDDGLPFPAVLFAVKMGPVALRQGSAPRAMIRLELTDVPTGVMMTLAVVRAFREQAVLIAVVIAQSLDTLTFLPAVTRVGIQAERNVLVRHLYVSYGPAGPILLKLAAIAVLVVALLWIRSRFPKAVPLVAFAIAAVGLVGAWSNLSSGVLH